jgi:predicted metalloprotease with PDZ domain
LISHIHLYKVHPATNMREIRIIVAFLILLVLTVSEGVTQTTPAIPPPQDTAYPGSIRLMIDATDTDRHIFRIRETIPVRGGSPAVLLYPQWLPGQHSPAGRIESLGGLRISAKGERLDWKRDPSNVFAFHVNVPAGTAELNVEFQFLTAVDSGQGRIVITPEMLNLQWSSVIMYPAGHFSTRIQVEPSVQLPRGWQFATALEAASTKDDTTTFKPVTLETLVDSPMFAGRFFKRLELGMTGPAPVRLNIIADRQELLEVKPEQLDAHRMLVQQAHKLFGSHHYDHYDFLLALTDRMGGIGLEHHQSSENGTVPGYFTEWDKEAGGRDLLPHEYTHSWNGKFRRPADLWTPNFNSPMRDSLLWVYEGQTQYWGDILAARAGLLTKQQTLDAFAMIAATYDQRVGREWRPLQDTTNDPIIAMRRPLPWRSWQRSEDYYSEGELIWLDIDTLIREQSRGMRSLDDFARRFFGINDGSYVPVTYTFEDVVSALNTVQPYDWATFLRTRLEGHGPGAPLDGLARGGYKLTYTEMPSDLFKESETSRKVTDLTYSLGIVVGNEGRLTDVLWQGPAFDKGLTMGSQIVAINGIAYSADRLKDQITQAKNASDTLELLIKSGDRYRTITMDYHAGLRYPRLERVANVPDRLGDILSAR